MPPPKDPIKYQEWLKKVKEASIITHLDLSWRQKQKNSHIGKKCSELTKQRMSKSHIGYQHSMESIKLMKLKAIGRKHTDITKQKLKNINIGKYCSYETRKKMSENHKEQYGKNNPMWKGGTSFEPYCQKFNNDLKERVRSFWDYKCGICNKQQHENNQKLSVHHVHYDKEVCCNDRPVMFIPLCTNCHSKTNGKRDYYQKFFEDLIYNKFNGKSYYTKEDYENLK